MTGLPDRLGAPGPRLATLLSAAWLACLLAVLVIQGVSAWRQYVFDTRTQPAFASVGLVTVRADSKSWFVRPADKASAKKGGERNRQERAKLFKGRVVAVNGQRVVGLSAEQVAERITVAARPVELRLAHIGKLKHRPPETVSVVPNAADRHRVFAKEDRTFKITTQVIDLALALLLIAVSFVVWRGHFRSAVNIAFTFVMLLAATVGSSRFWQYAGNPDLLYYAYAAWIGLLLAILPAWPDGEFRPRWTRWSLVGGPVVAFLVFWNRKAIEQSSLLSISILMAIIVPLMLFARERFRTEQDRRERQQLKWVFVGFGFGLLLVVAGLLIPENGAGLPEILAPLARYGSFALRRAGVFLLVSGLLFSLIRFRLNDTDAVIGRSAAYASLMTSLAVVFALGEAFTDNAVKAIAGSSNATLALSLSTIITVVLLAPTRDRMLDWTQRYFQRGLIRLQELPHRLVRWHAHTPQELAEKALRIIDEGVDPECAALVWTATDQPPLVLAANRISPGDVLDRAANPDARSSQSPLPVRIDAPDGAPPLVLLLGRRGDGASYTREERESLAALLDPLAEVEQSAFLRVAREQALTHAIDDLRQRLRPQRKPRELTRPRAC